MIYLGQGERHVFKVCKAVAYICCEHQQLEAIEMLRDCEHEKRRQKQLCCSGDCYLVLRKVKAPLYLISAEHRRSWPGSWRRQTWCKWAQRMVFRKFSSKAATWKQIISRKETSLHGQLGNKQGRSKTGELEGSPKKGSLKERSTLYSHWKETHDV